MGPMPERTSELMPYHRRMPELVFEVVQESDGGYCAECLTQNIFTQGDTWDELRKNVLEATAAFFFDQPRPERIRLHLVRDEILSVA
jgi:predicted RNase H-like HicB family nuclease